MLENDFTEMRLGGEIFELSMHKAYLVFVMIGDA